MKKNKQFRKYLKQGEENRWGEKRKGKAKKQKNTFLFILWELNRKELLQLLSHTNCDICIHISYIKCDNYYDTVVALEKNKAIRNGREKEKDMMKRLRKSVEKKIRR